jgi:hypothetical protein
VEMLRRWGPAYSAGFERPRQAFRRVSRETIGEGSRRPGPTVFHVKHRRAVAAFDSAVDLGPGALDVLCTPDQWVRAVPSRPAGIALTDPIRSTVPSSVEDLSGNYDERVTKTATRPSRSPLDSDPCGETSG